MKNSIYSLQFDKEYNILLQVARGDVPEVQVFWKVAEGQTRTKRRSDALRWLLLLQVCSSSRFMPLRS